MIKHSRKTIWEIFVAISFAVPALIAMREIRTRFVRLEMASGGGGENAALFPRVLSWSLLALVLVQITSLLIKANKRNGGKDTANLSSSSQDAEFFLCSPVARKRLIIVMIVLSAYVYGLQYAGFYVATPLVLVVLFFMTGVRLLWLLPLALGTTAVLWYFFGVLLKVVLPVGQFGVYF